MADKNTDSARRKEARLRYETKMKPVRPRYNSDEYKNLTQKAEFHGISITTYVKKKSLGRTHDLVKVPAINLKVKSELRRIGTNINQLAKYLNTYKTSAEIKTIEAKLIDSLAELKQVMATIG